LIKKRSLNASRSLRLMSCRRSGSMTEKEKLLADHLAAMCCQADEDCPAEYRTEHFRSTMDDAYDYLREIGYLK
jgi:hypothetical protein